MATKTVLETLEAARTLISDRKHWTKGEYARYANGKRADWNSETACKFCAIGAISRASGRFSCTGDAWIALRDSMGEMPHYFNDSHKHAEVLAAFDAAIEKAKVTA